MHETATANKVASGENSRYIGTVYGGIKTVRRSMRLDVTGTGHSGTSILAPLSRSHFLLHSILQSTRISLSSYLLNNITIMATSANPAMQKYSARTQVIAHVSLKMAQTVAMIVPPVYVVATLARRRPFTIRGLMNTSTAWTTGGALAGVGIGYARLMNEPQAKIDDRAVRLVSP